MHRFRVSLVGEKVFPVTTQRGKFPGIKTLENTDDGRAGLIQNVLTLVH